MQCVCTTPMSHLTHAGTECIVHLAFIATIDLIMLQIANQQYRFHQKKTQDSAKEDFISSTRCIAMHGSFGTATVAESES